MSVKYVKEQKKKLKYKKECKLSFLADFIEMKQSKSIEKKEIKIQTAYIITLKWICDQHNVTIIIIINITMTTGI